MQLTYVGKGCLLALRSLKVKREIPHFYNIVKVNQIYLWLSKNLMKHICETHQMKNFHSSLVSFWRKILAWCEIINWRIQYLFWFLLKVLRTTWNITEEKCLRRLLTPRGRQEKLSRNWFKELMLIINYKRSFLLS